MLKDALIEIYERDLSRLKNEIELYRDEDSLWIVRNEISNSAGNLCLHLIGNLQHFIGAVLGDSGYERDRDSEFSSKDISQNQLIANIEETKKIVNKTLNNLPDEMLDSDFPATKRGEIVKTDFMLLHLLTHLNYHLGQINYHRRLISQ
jgi:uncharacterized damage-inducible protein DinB